jgi:hypothetical protein
MEISIAMVDAVSAVHPQPPLFEPAAAPCRNQKTQAASKT